MHKFLSLLAVAALAFGLAGCGRTGPSVNLVTVHFKDASLLETTSEFIIRLSNDSPEPEKFTGSAHKIYINGLYVGKGLSADTIEVPRLGSVTQAITVHLNNLELATRVRSVIDSKSFEYKVSSTFFGDSIFSRMRSETSGKLALSDFMPDTDTNTLPADSQPPMPAPPATPAADGSPALPAPVDSTPPPPPPDAAPASPAPAQ